MKVDRLNDRLELFNAFSAENCVAPTEMLELAQGKISVDDFSDRVIERLTGSTKEDSPALFKHFKGQFRPKNVPFVQEFRSFLTLNEKTQRVELTYDNAHAFRKAYCTFELDEKHRPELEAAEKLFTRLQSNAKQGHHSSGDIDMKILVSQGATNEYHRFLHDTWMRLGAKRELDSINSQEKEGGDNV